MKLNICSYAGKLTVSVFSLVGFGPQGYDFKVFQLDALHVCACFYQKMSHLCIFHVSCKKERKWVLLLTFGGEERSIFLVSSHFAAPFSLRALQMVACGHHHTDLTLSQLSQQQSLEGGCRISFSAHGSLTTFIVFSFFTIISFRYN